jgi:hypothetical protein
MMHLPSQVCPPSGLSILSAVALCSGAEHVGHPRAQCRRL